MIKHVTLYQATEAELIATLGADPIKAAKSAPGITRTAKNGDKVYLVEYDGENLYAGSYMPQESDLPVAWCPSKHPVNSQHMVMLNHHV